MFKHVIVIETEKELQPCTKDRIVDAMDDVLHTYQHTNFITCTCINQASSENFLAVPNATTDGRARYTLEG